MLAWHFEIHTHPAAPPLSFCKNQLRGDTSILLKLEGSWRLTNESVTIKSQSLHENIVTTVFFFLTNSYIFECTTVCYGGAAGSDDGDDDNGVG